MAGGGADRKGRRAADWRGTDRRGRERHGVEGKGRSGEDRSGWAEIMNLTVYIPKELMDQAKAAGLKGMYSQLLQDAIREELHIETNMTKLKQVRKQHGLSQNEAAALVHIGQRSFARYESGQRDPPESVLELFALKLGLDYEQTFKQQ